MSLLLAAALLAQPSVLAGDATSWERLSPDAAGIVLSLDPASLRPEGGLIRVRWRSDHQEGELNEGARTLVVHALVDCRAGTFSFRRIEGYRADGSLIQAFDVAAGEPQAEPHPFPPSDEPIHRRICEGAAD